MKTNSKTIPILIFAVTLSIFTQLRISFFGFGEIIILLVFLTKLATPIKRVHINRFIFTKFWLLYIAISIVGALVNQVILERPTGTPAQMLFDFAAYLFLLITCFTFEKLYFERSLRVQYFLPTLFLFSSGILSILFIVSFFTPELFGFQLRYYTYFAPMVDNVHQVSMYLAMLPFVGVLVLSESSSQVQRIIVMIFVILSIWMVLMTGSTKASMAIVVGAVILAYGYSVRGAGRAYLVPINAVYLIGLVIALSSLDLYAIGEQFFREADPVAARETLYSRAVAVVLDSLLVGHGPGPHVLYHGVYYDVHQTHLAVLLQTGLLGLAVYIWLTVKLISRLYWNPALIAAFAAYFVYSAGGDVLRRLPVWILVLLIYYWQDSNSDKRVRSAKPSHMVRLSHPHR